jgi:hypothetical protein
VRSRVSTGTAVVAILVVVVVIAAIAYSAVLRNAARSAAPE